MRLLGGKPLVQWIIEAAIEADIFEHVFVSSDDEDILTLAERMMGDYPIIPTTRPDHLAGDDVRAEEVFSDVVGRLREPPEIVCMAMPTAPFTTAGSLRGAYEWMVAREFDAVCITSKTRLNTLRTLFPAELNRDGTFRYRPVCSMEALSRQSQDLKPTYRPTYGGMFVKTEILLETHRYYAPHQSIYNVRHPENIDIDTEEDWQQAERYLRDRSRKERA